ncbi:unnamed protein product [Pipistrellus nathusii]|uniref:Uncharacterized protein n=1 Tax=Pipistrellus nathusii TaxID=59473 RepID=A0ABN9ZG03_PIPNA
MVYYRFTNMERTVRTHCGWRGSVKTLTVLLLQPGSVSLPREMFGFLLPRLLRPLRYRLSQTGQCPGTQPPPPSLPGGQPCEEPSSQSPLAVGRFLWRCSVACSSNKLVAIKADAVFS